MLNILFWMTLLFITAVILITVWIREAEERMLAKSDRKAQVQGKLTGDEPSARNKSQAHTQTQAEMLRQVPVSQQSLEFFTIPTRTLPTKLAAQTSQAPDLYKPFEETPCEIFDLTGHRVA